MSEEQIVRHCSPTLAGMKTGSMFSCSFASRDALYREIRAFNRELSPKGLRIVPLRLSRSRALIYVYRPSQLARDLGSREHGRMLAREGYRSGCAGKCLAQLIGRLRTQEHFPHEIGLFLGYPPEDVKGFMESKDSCKCVGCWKVYGDAEQAQKTFAKYRRCTDLYLRELRRGRTIGSLTVSA